MGPDIQHSRRAHALLSASGAPRWINCTPSPRLEERFPEETETEEAEEGTLAHELAELILLKETDQVSPEEFNTSLKAIQDNELYEPNMYTSVMEYVEYVLEIYAERKAAQNTPVYHYIELKLDLSEYVKDSFGTGDSGIVSDNYIDVIDLKYGRGLKVLAFQNEQLKMYALGFLRKHRDEAQIKGIRLHIVQPRLNNFSTYELSVADLRKWAETVVRPAALKAYEGKGVQKAGSWCRWCAVKARCATLASTSLSLADQEFKAPHFLNDEQLTRIYGLSDIVQLWVKSVKDYMLSEAKKGREWKGLKLVSGQSRRVWSNDKEALQVLTDELLLEASEVTNLKIKGFGDLEAILGKKTFNDSLRHLIIKPQGAPTLVTLDDPRPSLGLQSAQADFDDGYVPPIEGHDDLPF